MSKELEGDTTEETTEELEGKKKAADSTEDKSTGDSTQSKKTDDMSSDENWEKRFKGLQPKHQTLVEEHKDLKVQIVLDKKAWDEEKVKLGLEIDELKGDVTKFTDSSDGLTKTNDELSKSVDSMKAQLERNTLIMGDYPDLAVLEAKGLLPTALEGDELTTALDDMRSLMTAKGESAARDLVAGSTGESQTTGSRSQATDIGSLGELLMKAQKDRDYDEVNRLTDLLVKQADTEIFQQE